MFITARTKIVLTFAAVVMGTLVLTANTANAAILISPGTGAGDDIKNGGFESATTGGNANYSQLDDWFNYTGTGDAILGAGGGSFAQTGVRGGSVSRGTSGQGGPFASPAVDTDYTIAAGDKFNLTFSYKGETNWDNGNDAVTVTLYSTTGDIWSDTVLPLTTMWQSYTANGIAAANIGETLFLRFEAPGLIFKEFSAVDDVTLSVSASVSSVPEPASVVLAAFGLLGLVGFGRRRKR